MSGGAFIGGCVLLGWLIGSSIDSLRSAVVLLAQAIEKLKR